MRKKLKSKSKKDGFILIVVAGSLLAFCGILGLAVDIGHLSLQRRQMQAAADSAALGGAMELLRGNSGLIVSAAQADSDANGYKDGVDAVTVTVNRPPASGANAGNQKYVEVLVARAAPTFFMKALGMNSVALQARAVAGLIGEPNCLFALAPSGSGTLAVNGLSIINVPCGVAVDSADSNALTTGGNACLNATSIAVTGTGPGYSGCTSPTPLTDAVASGDPLGYLAAPAAGACSFGTGTTPFSQNTLTTVSIDPGVYCGGISATKGTLNLTPGLYILKGGGFTLSGSITLNGDGVTFYNTCTDGSCTNTSGYAPASVTGGSTFHVAAPTTGVWAGMLFFSDRKAPNSFTNGFAGNGEITLTGTLYFPSQTVTFGGGISGAALYTNIVAWKMSFSGSSTLNHDLSVLPDGSPLKKVAMIE